ncbi:F-box protein At2g39490 [Ricinus communis]|uniref:F-box protein At2g39490 n=1 Tax=Ricinus communis TaxID=3988 RepID=UPI00201AEA41|nr:F-box protein At2g39490 [Ricinus communis]XP_048232151.1 F-box protein At2g39490 [Ricinus communis]
MDDRISSMPDEIIFHIICSLPFESAIQTIFLSKRWRFLWDTSLVQHGTEEDVASAICSFLENFNERDPLTNTRKFRFHFVHGNVLLAIIAPNNKLFLDFSDEKQEFHRQFKLQLEFNNPQNLVSQPSPSTFFVKNLHLTSVSFLTSEAVSSILTKFQFLETLKITCCNCLQSLSIGSDTKLLSLTIFDCLPLEFLHIRSFKLRTFRYRGSLPSFLPEYHYNLVDAFLDFRQGPRTCSIMTNHDLDLVLLTIKNVKILTLCKWTFEALICPVLSTFLAEFQFYNLKELWWIDNSDQEYDCDALISFLKLCPSLEQLFVTIDPKSYYMERTATCSIQAGRNTKLKHLKMVKLDRFSNEADEIHLAKCLQQIITSEPLIFASSNGSCMRRLIHDPLHQLKQKGIGSLEVAAGAPGHETKFSYTSVEVRDMNQLCPKHVHMDL